MYGATGFGARITVAMNVKTGKEIGHPSSSYIWDVVSFAENCLIDAGISWKLFIGKNYINSIRIADSIDHSRFSEQIFFINSSEDQQFDSNPLISAHSNGNWYFSTTGINTIHQDYSNMPFGPVILQITGFEEYKMNFPIRVLEYLISTLERGEEPMEKVGKGNYSAVSGWKAHARWIQAYSLPMKGIRHEYLTNIAAHVQQRRKGFVNYWKNLSKILEIEKEIEFANNLAESYEPVIPILNKIVDEGNKLEFIKELYYTEQKTLPVYKQIRNYIRNLKRNAKHI